MNINKNGLTDYNEYCNEWIDYDDDWECCCSYCCVGACDEVYYEKDENGFCVPVFDISTQRNKSIDIILGLSEDPNKKPTISDYWPQPSQ